MISGVLTPCYGRDYKSLKAAQADFDLGKDFNLNTPLGETIKISIRDFQKEGQKTVQVRYKKMTETGFLKIKPLVEEKSTFYID